MKTVANTNKPFLNMIAKHFDRIAPRTLDDIRAEFESRTAVGYKVDIVSYNPSKKLPITPMLYYGLGPMPAFYDASGSLYGLGGDAGTDLVKINRPPP